MSDMELVLAWKTQQGYADCSTSLAEHDKQIRDDAINELVNLVIECGMSMGWVDADSFIELAEQLKESKE